MKFSEQWLREWISPSVSTEELGHRLTMAGLEVDAIEPAAGDFTNVVVGEVLSVEKHPDADKLKVCKVDVGEADPLQIVCGASNVAVAMRVPTALVGAKLPGGLKIKKGKLRGEASHGMLCSAVELGLAEQAEGLMPLPMDAKPGTDIRDYLNLNDVCIELGITPNRGDCLGMIGLAREAGVLFNSDTNSPDMSAVKAGNSETLAVDVQASEACPRYSGRIIRDVDMSKQTPLWMQERLRRSGLRAINPVVDVTNYVLLELGQPMHAFDMDTLHGGIWVRHAMRNESLTLLDGNRVDLTPETLIIADVKGPLAIAGIMGGEKSGVTTDSKHLFLESAFFAPLSIAGRARSYGLHTDSSHRFERGVDPNIQVTALERATSLLLDIVGGAPGPVIEVVSKPHLPSREAINLRASRISRVLGLEVDSASIPEVLTRLGMHVEEQANGLWKVTPPSFRFDIGIEADLIEEVGRIIGYDNIPATAAMSSLGMSEIDESVIPLRKIRQRLVDRGYQEVVTYSFIDPAQQKRFSPSQAAIALSNPLAADMSVMRTSLLPGLLETVKYNLNRQQDRVQIFESGVKYILQDADIKEERTLSLAVSGNITNLHWDVEKRAFDYYDMKADIEALLEMAGSLDGVEFSAGENPVLHPGQSARITRNNDEIGWIGALHPVLAHEMGLPNGVICCELQLDGLQKGTIPQLKAVSKYPSIRRDIAIIVDTDITAESVCKCIKNVAGEYLINLELFDVYSGKGIDSGRKSLALGLTLQASSRTLTEEDVESVMNNVLKALSTDCSANLRE